MTKPRKGQKYVPELGLLLRDAMPTWSELEGETSARKRRKNERACDLAIDELLSMYRDHARRGKIRELDPRVRIFCEQLMQLNGGVLPKRKGGRPSADKHRNLLIAVAVEEALAAQKGKRRNVRRAIQHVSDTLDIAGKRVHMPAATIRDIYYRPDPEWQRAIKVEMARRAQDA